MGDDQPTCAMKRDSVGEPFRSTVGFRNRDPRRVGGHVKKRFGCLQVDRVEAFGEAVVDGLKQCSCLGGSALIAPQLSEAYDSMEFPG
jgi:hypothetical protein